MKAPHLSVSCKFNDNETLASYANGIYDYYDVEQTEEFVAFMGAYEIESLFKTCENLDDVVYRPGNFSILKYCYENYEYNADIDAFIEKVSAAQEETNILQESMKEEIIKTVSSLEEKDDEEIEEKKISYPCPPSNESNPATHTFLMSLLLPKDECYDNCYDPINSFEICLFDEIDACYTCDYDDSIKDTYENDFSTVIYDNPCYFDKSYDNFQLLICMIMRKFV